MKMRLGRESSAQANAWLHALGYDLPEEIIILPGEGPKSIAPERIAEHTVWEQDVLLDVFPNPSAGPVYAAYQVPEGMEHVELRVLDVYGRVLTTQWLGQGAGLSELSTGNMAAGIYLAELRLNGKGIAQAKISVQR